MAVDKNLFLYDLAVVAIMHNEGPYVKEWLDYHLLAGVDHFYIYDHESTDNFKEVLKPYINAGIVTYTFYPGKIAQDAAYNDAVNKYRFFCRYMAFIDADEFIFPQNNKSIVEVADEILESNPNAGGLGINWRMFGSNNLEKADYTRGVLERFTRCQENFNKIVKTVANPRKIKFIENPHYAIYFEGYFSVNENGETFQGSLNESPTGDKIYINHYNVKSKEEYLRKIQRGRVDIMNNTYNMQDFVKNDFNDIFNDEILKYRENRLKTGGGTVGRQINYQRLYNALLQNLSATLINNFPKEFFVGKLETFLTCRKLAEYLRGKFFDEETGNFFEDTALKAIPETLKNNISMADIKFLFSEMPKILALNYPSVNEIKKACTNILPNLIYIYRINGLWRYFYEMNYLLEIFNTFDNYNHK